MELVLGAGAEDMQNAGDVYEITCDPTAYLGLKKAIEEKNIPIQSAEISMMPQTMIPISTGRDGPQDHQAHGCLRRSGRRAERLRELRYPRGDHCRGFVVRALGTDSRCFPASGILWRLCFELRDSFPGETVFFFAQSADDLFALGVHHCGTAAGSCLRSRRLWYSARGRHRSGPAARPIGPSSNQSRSQPGYSSGGLQVPIIGFLVLAQVAVDDRELLVVLVVGRTSGDRLAEAASRLFEQCRGSLRTVVRIAASTAGR